MINDTPKPKRTLKQNKSIHSLFKILSDDLNTLGLDMKVVLKPSYQIWWTPESVKEHLWKPLQKAMYQKESTTELNTAEVSKVYEQLAHILGEKFGAEVEFPNYQQTKEFIETYDQTN
ncbi:MAG: hypothetical protein ACR2IQ_02750 [Minisyncoccia bacterium]